MSTKVYLAISIFFVILSLTAVCIAQGGLIVNKTADTNDGSCDFVDCSLREAIEAADLDPTTGTKVINFTQLFNVPQQIALNNELVVSSAGPVIINGPGANLLTLHMAGTARIFRGSTPLTLKGMILEFGQGRGGGVNGKGSAIYFSGFSGPLILDTVILQNNDTTSISASEGAVYYSGGTGHRIINSTFTGNTSANCGAFETVNADVSVLNSTISGNSVFTFGGGVCINGGTTKFRSSTIAGNIANVSGNAAGGGIFLQNGTLNLGNTIVAGNTANSAPDIDLFGAMALVTVGGNLIGNNSTVAPQFPFGQANINSDWVGDAAAPLNPLLAPLGNYGGITPTRALSNVSAAVDHGTFIFGETPAEDQRGGTRDNFIDIGAFEFNAAYVGVLPVAIINQPYFRIIAQNNNGFTYCVSSGTLPPGLTGVPQCAPPLVARGSTAPQFAGTDIVAATDAVVAISGTPVTPGMYDFSISATSGTNTVVTNYELIVAGPTAEAVSVGGRVLMPDGRGIAQVVVTLTDANAVTMAALSNTFGFFRFDSVAAGQAYVVRAQSRHYQFSDPTRVVSVADVISDLNFVALPPTRAVSPSQGSDPPRIRR